MPEALYVTATQAARMIGVNERTIRLWIKSGELLATHTKVNRFAIPMSEVQRIIDDREQKRELNAIPSPRELARQIESLKEELRSERTGTSEDMARWISTVEARIKRLEERVFGDPETGQKAVFPKPTAKRESRAQYPVEPLPGGALSIQEFAKQQGVAPTTAINHAENGIRGEKLEVSTRPRPGRPDQVTRYLTPEQQQSALDYWYKHGVLKKETT